jgi:hypothetical protein
MFSKLNLQALLLPMLINFLEQLITGPLLAKLHERLRAEHPEYFTANGGIKVPAKQAEDFFGQAFEGGVKVLKDELKAL